MVSKSAFDLVFTFVVLTNSIFIGVELQMALSHPNGSQTAVQILGAMGLMMFPNESPVRFG